jgi:large subunit ribosomal protein L5
MAKEQDPKQAKPDAKSEGKPAGGKPEGKGGGKGDPRRDAGKKAPSKASKHEHEGPVEPPPAPRLKKLFDESVRAKVAEHFGIKNPMAQPRLQKITINVNMGRHIEGTKIPANIRSTVLDTIVKISGQKPVVVKAKKSVSNFKVREGIETAAMVTMRRQRMWHFLDRFINLATPRIKDFRGLPRNAFDRQGSYSVGVNEQGVFPEINMAEVTFTHGMNINFVFSNSSPDKSRFVLEQLGMPLAKPEERRVKAETKA